MPMSSEIDWPPERPANVEARSGYRGINEAGFAWVIGPFGCDNRKGQRSRTCNKAWWM